MTVEADSGGQTSMPTPRVTSPVPGAAEQVYVPMRDGTRLATDLYLPSGRGPFPAIVTRLPYDKDHPENFLEAYAAAATERGYAFVAQDTRGKIRSEGEYMPFEGEALDGYDALEWVSGQSWCNESLAMCGVSYFGYTQWAGVAGGHPGLRAITPVTTASMVGTDWFSRQGVLSLGLLAHWCAVTWSDKGQYEWDLELPWDVRPLADVVANRFGGDRSRSRVFDRLRSLDPNDPFWVQSTYLGRNPAYGASVAGLHHGGWWDVFTRGQIHDWAVASRTSGLPHHLIMDSFDHGMTEWSLDPAPFPDFTEIPRDELMAFGGALMQAPLELFDHVLRGRENTLPRVSWKLTHDEWRSDDQWPPAGAKLTVLYLEGDPGSAEGARLIEHRPVATRWASWIHDPNDLVPGPAIDLFDLAAPPDDSLVEHRPDVLVFTGDPLEDHLDLAGPMRAEVQVGSSAASMHVMVRLIDVFPDGRTRRIRDGAALVRNAGADPHVIVDLGATGYRMQPGHRLRVHVASSDFPRYLPYFGDDRDPWTATEGIRNEQRLRIGGRHGSRIALTTL